MENYKMWDQESAIALLTCNVLPLQVHDKINNEINKNFTLQKPRETPYVCFSRISQLEIFI
jgi:hypothetical protein